MIRFSIFIAWFFVLLQSCAQDQTEPYYYDPDDIEREIATDVEMIYSDSAVIQFVIHSPELIKYEDADNVMVEEFPKGFRLQFYDSEKNVISELNSKYALRKSAEGLLILRDSVSYTNESQDILETNALTIDELNQSIKTKKFFRLINGSSQDTTYGRGFEANSDFSRFEVTKYLGKRKGIDINNS